MRIYKKNGNTITLGGPIEIDGISYPWNWFDHASAEDLAKHGFTFEDVPDPPEVIAEQQRKTSLFNDPNRLDMLTRLRSASASQIDTWVNNNVTDIASARNVIKMILKVIALDART